LGSDTTATFHDAHCTAYTTRACGPVLAAAMWSAVAHACHACTAVIAGDFSSAAGLEPGSGTTTYLSIYAHHLPPAGHRGAPTIWAVHPYHDTSTFEWQCRGHNAPQCLAQHANPKLLASTVVAHFASHLAGLGYHSRAQIWLDEVSTYTLDMNKHHYSQRLQ